MNFQRKPGRFTGEPRVAPKTLCVNPYDDIVITGTAGNGRRYVGLHGTVGTVSPDGAIKVWPDPDEAQLTADDRYCGKIWFCKNQIESLAIVQEDV